MDANIRRGSEEQQFVASICKRLNDARQLIDLSEIKLGEMIGRKQGSVSRILKGDGLNMHMLFKLCKALDVDVTEIIIGKSEKDEKKNKVKEEHNKKSEEIVITDASSVRFTGYLGKYKGYFFSTVSSDEKIHKGDFCIFKQKESNKCFARFSFETGKTSEKTRKPIVKHYKGPVKLSQRLGAISCELTAQDKSGDLSYIIFEHRDKINECCECALGMVVTICAGGSRHPVAHRFLICRQELSDKDLCFIKGQLKLNDKKILISEQNYRAFINDDNLPATFTFRNEQGNDIFINSAKPQIYYQFSENDVSKVSSMNDVDVAKTVSLLREYSCSKPSTKIGKQCGDYIFAYLRNKKRRGNREE